MTDPFTLPDIELIGGTTGLFIFDTVFGESDIPFNLEGCTANFAIINFVNKFGNPIISRQMEIVTIGSKPTYALKIKLAPKDTLELYGKYIYQITIKSQNGDSNEIQQGIIYIHNNINKEIVR